MKELSIEEKAKRYDEAIKRAKECHTDGLSLHQPVKDVLEHIFPELKESEDERIRKEMIEILEKEAHDFPSSVIAEKSNSWIVWLEKQGEQKSIDNLTPQEAMDIAVAKCFEQGEYKPVDKVEPIFNVGDKIQYLKGCGTIMTIEKIENGEYMFANNMGHITIESGNKWYLVEQNFAWSEEDKKIIKRIDSLLYSQCKIHGLEYEEIHNWLRCIKNRCLPQPMQKWSGDDEKMLNDTIQFIETGWTNKGKSHLISWLKSLKERYTWKPSDEQLKQLSKYCTDNRILTELYEQLKAL